MANAADQYLKQLRRELSPLPAQDRDAFTSDIATHIAESVAGGAAEADVLSSLGDPRTLAVATFRELDEASPRTARTRRARRILAIATVSVAIVTAIFVTHLLEGFDAASQTAAVLLGAFLPAVVTAAAGFLPLRASMWTNLALAGVLAGTALLGLGIVGFYLPVAFLAFATALVPLAVSRGFNLTRAPGWRWGGAVLILLPLAFVTLRTLGAPGPTAPLVVGVAAASALLAVLFGVGLTVASYGLAVAGTVLLLMVFLPADIVLLPAWLIGSLLFAVGLTAIATTWAPNERSA